MLTFDKARIANGAFTLTADWAIEARSHISILGPSGGGKSTLLAALGGYLPLKSGRILWNSRDLAPLSPAQRPVAMLFQDHNVFPHLTVAQNVGLGLRPDLRLTPAQQDAVRRALTRVGLDGYDTRRPAALSGGQTSRVALARVSLQERPILALDEPFAALGPALRREMLDQVLTLCDEQELTLLMVTHTPEDAVQVGGQTVFVDAGAAQAPVDTETLFANPPDALARYL